MYQQMMFAIMSGDIKPIQEFISSDKTNVNIRDKMGRSLLMEAAIFKREDIAKFLVENGADVNAQEKKWWTALHFAVESFLPDTVMLLIEKGANVNALDFYDNTPLQKAIFSSKGKGDIIKLLLKAGADRNLANKSGISPYQVVQKITNYNIKQYFES